MGSGPHGRSQPGGGHVEQLGLRWATPGVLTDSSLELLHIDRARTSRAIRRALVSRLRAAIAPTSEPLSPLEEIVSVFSGSSQSQ
jgi:hypothetical protein